MSDNITIYTSIDGSPVRYRHRVTQWLDKDECRITEEAPNTFFIRAGRQLTLDEIKGAIVKHAQTHKTLPNGMGA